MASEPNTVGLSPTGHITLTQLEQSGVFHRLVDAYRFAVALGLSHGGLDRGNVSRRTIFNVGTLDPDRSLFEAVVSLREDTTEPVYRTLERYAEWGVAEMARMRSGGEMEFGPLLKEAEDLLD